MHRSMALPAKRPLVDKGVPNRAAGLPKTATAATLSALAAGSGVNGISLGGYLTSLVATIDDGLTCAILGVPLADLLELVGRHAGLSHYDDLRQMLKLAKPIGAMISPLALSPRVPMQGRFIYAGIADRLVHPRDEAARLWEHWGRPEICWYPGGHTGFFRSRPVQRFIDDALVKSGLVDPAPTRRNP